MSYLTELENTIQFDGDTKVSILNLLTESDLILGDELEPELKGKMSRR